MRMLFFLICTFFGLHSDYNSIEKFDENSYVFENKTLDTNASIVRQLPKELYTQAVKNLPIVCVDVFVLNMSKKEYLLVLRENQPAKNMYWLPGGRMYKGESFFTSAQRKCFEEVGLQVSPVQVLDVYSTIFSDSAWECSTQTINIAVLVLCDADNSKLTIDKLHSEFKWVSLYARHENDYINQIRCKVLEGINAEYKKDI